MGFAGKLLQYELESSQSASQSVISFVIIYQRFRNLIVRVASTKEKHVVL